MLDECSKLVKQLWSGRHSDELKSAEKRLVAYQGWSLASKCLTANEYALILLGGQMLESKLRGQHVGRPRLSGILEQILMTLIRLEDSSAFPDPELYQAARDKTKSLMGSLYSSADDLIDDLKTEIIVNSVNYVKQTKPLSNIYLALAEVPAALQQRLAMCYEPGEAAFCIPYFNEVDSIILNALQAIPKLIIDQQYELLCASCEVVGSHLRFIRKLPKTKDAFTSAHETLLRVVAELSQSSQIRCLENSNLAKFIYQMVAADPARTELLRIYLQLFSWDTSRVIQEIADGLSSDLALIPSLSAGLETATDWLVQACSEIFSDYKIPANVKIIQQIFNFLRSCCFLRRVKVSASVIECVDIIAEALKNYISEMEWGHRAVDPDFLSTCNDFAQTILSIWLPHIYLTASVLEEDEVFAFCEGSFNAIALMLPLYAPSLEALNHIFSVSFSMSSRSHPAIHEFWKTIGDSLVISFGHSPECHTNVLKVMHAMITSEILPGILSILETGVDILSPNNMKTLLCSNDNFTSLITCSTRLQGPDALNLLSDLALSAYTINNLPSTLADEIKKRAVVCIQTQDVHQVMQVARMAMYTGCFAPIVASFTIVGDAMSANPSLEVLQRALAYLFSVFEVAYEVLAADSEALSKFVCQVIELASSAVLPLLELGQSFLIGFDECQQMLRRSGRTFNMSRQTLSYQLRTKENEPQADTFNVSRLIYHTLVLLLFLTFDSQNDNAILDIVDLGSHRTFPSEPGFIGIVESLSRMLSGHQRSRLLNGIVERNKKRGGRLWGVNSASQLVFPCDIDAEPNSIILRCLLKVYLSLTSVLGKRDFVTSLAVPSHEGIAELRQILIEILSRATDGLVLTEACSLLALVATEQSDMPQIAKIVFERYANWSQNAVHGATKLINIFIYESENNQLILDFVTHVVLPELGKHHERFLVDGLLYLRGRLLMKLYEDIWRLKNNEISLNDIVMQIDLTRPLNQKVEIQYVTIEDD